MKICVYAICKNEILHMEEWLKLVQPADYICVLDTGSTDGTWEVLQKAAEKQPGKVIIAQKKYDFFRFDVARNDSIELVPEDADLCWSLDIDEYPIEGWREYVEKQWNPAGGYTRLLYWYAMGYDWKNDNITSNHLYDKLTVNAHQYKWIHAVHEFMVRKDGKPNVDKYVNDKTILVYHHQTVNRGNRDQYFKLLQLRIEEEPKDIFAYSFVLGEMWSRRMYQEIIDLITSKMMPLFYDKDTNLEDWRRPSMYAFAMSYLGICYDALGQDDFARHAFENEMNGYPELLNGYIHLGKWYMDHKKYKEAVETLLNGLKNATQKGDWQDSNTWTEEIYDYLTQCFFQLGRYKQSYDCALLAAALNPKNERLKNNVEACKKFVIPNGVANKMA